MLCGRGACLLLIRGGRQGRIYAVPSADTMVIKVADTLREHAWLEQSRGEGKMVVFLGGGPIASILWL